MPVILGSLILFSTELPAQCKLKSGDVKKLKGQTSINLIYDYSNMAVGKFKNEQDYVKSKVEEMNKKKAGTEMNGLGNGPVTGISGSSLCLKANSMMY